MRIGLDYTSAVWQGAGIGRYCRELVQALVELDEENEYVLFVAGRPPPDQRQTLQARFGTCPNVRLRLAPIPERWLVRLWHRLQVPLPVEMFTGPLDIFHSPDFTLPPVRNAKKLLQIHDLSFLRVPEHADPRLRRFLETVVPRCVQQANLVLADSQHTKRDTVELLQVPSDRVMVILGAVEPGFHPVRDEQELERVRACYDLPESFILGLSTLEPRKNFIGLIEAYDMLVGRTAAPHHLVIGGGKGWLYEDIFRRVAELGLEDRVHFLGFVAEENLPALYTLADVFAYPSFYEGFGLPVLEAMACETPVVASNASSLPEVVGEAGLMVSPADTEGLARALERILTDPSLREMLVAHGRDQASRFTWERAARQLLSAYLHV